MSSSAGAEATLVDRGQRVGSGSDGCRIDSIKGAFTTLSANRIWQGESRSGGLRECVTIRSG